MALTRRCRWSTPRWPGLRRSAAGDSTAPPPSQSRAAQPTTGRTDSTCTGRGGATTPWIASAAFVPAAALLRVSSHVAPRSLSPSSDAQEVERCDALDGLLLLQSLAGGTGSGFGASQLRHVTAFPAETYSLYVPFPLPSLTL